METKVLDFIRLNRQKDVFEFYSEGKLSDTVPEKNHVDFVMLLKNKYPIVDSQKSRYEILRYLLETGESLDFVGMNDIHQHPSVVEYISQKDVISTLRIKINVKEIKPGLMELSMSPVELAQVDFIRLVNHIKEQEIQLGRVQYLLSEEGEVADELIIKISRIPQGVKS